MSAPLAELRGKLCLDGNTLRVDVPARIKGPLRIEGPGQIAIATEGPGLIAVGRLTLVNVDLVRVGGGGGLVLVPAGGALRLQGGSLAGACACAGYPAGVNSQGPAVEAVGACVVTGTRFGPAAFTHVSASGSAHVSLDRCVLEHADTWAIHTAGSVELKLVGCTLDASAGGSPASAGVAALELGGSGHTVIDGGRIAGWATGVSVTDQAQVAMRGVGIHGSTRAAIATFGGGTVDVQGGVVDGAGAAEACGLTAYAGRITLREATVRGVARSGVYAEGCALVQLFEGTVVEGVGGAAAWIGGTASLELTGCQLTGGERGVVATDLATVREDGATVAGPAPRAAYVLAQWYGATPEGPWVDAAEVLKSGWRALGAHRPEVRDAWIDALPDRIEWGWAGMPIPAELAAFRDVLGANRARARHGGQAAIDAVLLRAGVAGGLGAAIRTLLGLTAPLASWDWRELRTVPLPEPPTALHGDALGRLWSGAADGRVLLDGVAWATLSGWSGSPVLRLVIGEGARPTVACEGPAGVAWLDEAGRPLLVLRNGGESNAIVQLADGELEYTATDVTGHPTDRVTRRMRVARGEGGVALGARAIAIEQPCGDGSLAGLPLPGGNVVQLTPWALTLVDPRGAELSRWPGGPVVALGPAPARSVPRAATDAACLWLAGPDGVAVLIELVPVRPPAVVDPPVVAVAAPG